MRTSQDIARVESISEFGLGEVSHSTWIALIPKVLVGGCFWLHNTTIPHPGLLPVYLSPSQPYRVILTWLEPYSGSGFTVSESEQKV